MRVLDATEMRKAEDSAASAGVSKLLMMEAAGAAIARVVRALYDPRLKPSVLVVAGPGNNGGDGACAARHLQMDADVTVILLAGRERVKTDEANSEWKALSACPQVRVFEAGDARTVVTLQHFFSADVVIDAVFGTGVRGSIGEPYSTAISLLNESKGLRMAVDIPSGLDPDTGTDSGLVVRADVTVTLHAAKPGLLKRADVVGKLLIEEIGLPVQT